MSNAYREHRRQNLAQQDQNYARAMREREQAEAQREYEERYAPPATPSDAHAEWHRNSGVPMGQPGCPQDACHLPDDPEDFEQPTVRCGNKAAHGGENGYHFSAAEVRECYQATGRFNTGRQAGKSAISAEIEEAQKAHEEERRLAEARRSRFNTWRTIPVYGAHQRAYYALRSKSGEVHFFRVERPKTGKHAGKTFVTEQASDVFHRMPYERAGQVLDAIAADIEAAGVLYGQEIGRCYRCHRTLTDTESRAAGIGPDCRRKAG